MSRNGDAIRAACISGLGSGYAPFASGTWGSLVGAILWLVIWLVGGAWGASRVLVEVLVVVGIGGASVLSVLWGEWAIARYGRSDPKQFTLDEVAGQWVALLVMPMGLAAGWWPLACIVGGQFLLFRFFDIGKFPPARQAESLPAGWGVLTDDLVAGAYANIVGQVLWRLPWVAALVFPATG
jgi:phosphatidylglycerophosphatase A